MGETTGVEIKEEKTNKYIYMDVFAIFVSLFGTVWCLTYGIVKLVDMQALSAALNIFLGAVNGTCLIVNITTFIKRRFKIV